MGSGSTGGHGKNVLEGGPTDKSEQYQVNVVHAGVNLGPTGSGGVQCRELRNNNRPFERGRDPG